MSYNVQLIVFLFLSILFYLFIYYQILSNFDVHVFCFVFGHYPLDQGECAKGEG